jgi:type IV fimbrial biogenesis protein FimT
MAHLRIAPLRGFTLIEMMIAVSIFGLLIALSIPTFRVWGENTQIRSKAESILSGLQTARAEAVKQNRIVRFQLASTDNNACALVATGTFWLTSLDDPTTSCASAISDTTAPRVQARDNTWRPVSTLTVASVVVDNTATPTAVTPSTIRFNSLGRVVDPVQSGVWINVDNSSLAPAQSRDLRIVVTQNGTIRLCDPDTALPTGDPRRC